LTLPDYGDLGLEDVSSSESAPRLRISHKSGQYINSQTGETYDTFVGIPLGVIRGRVFFPREIDPSGNGKPLCKSPDAITGYPNINPALPRDKQFPWDGSGYVESEVPTDARGQKPIQCDACAYSNWRDKTPPPCAEQWTIPLVYPRRDEHTGEWGEWDNVILASFQKTSLTPAKKYATSFKQTRKPMFSAVVTLGLDMEHRGNVDYAVSTCTRGADVPQEDWPKYADIYRQFRDYLHEPPRVSNVAAIGAGGGGAPQQLPAASAPTPPPNAPVAQPNTPAAPPSSSGPATAPPAPSAPAAPTIAPQVSRTAPPPSVGTPPPPFPVPPAPSPGSSGQKPFVPPPPSPFDGPNVVEAVPDASPAETLGVSDEDDLPF